MLDDLRFVLTTLRIVLFSSGSIFLDCLTLNLLLEKFKVDSKLVLLTEQNIGLATEHYDKGTIKQVSRIDQFLCYYEDSAVN